MARKISGKLLALDIQRGASYEELLERYEVTPQAMDRFFKGLVDAGRVDASALPTQEHLKGRALSVCPKCAASLTADSEECPSCGILVSKFLKRKNEEEEKLRQAQVPSQPKKQSGVAKKTEHTGSPWGSLTILVAIVSLVLVVTFIVSNPVKHRAETSAGSNVQAPSNIGGDAVPVRAELLSEWYQANELKSDETYKGRTLAVTGVVGSVGRDITNTPYVSLKGSDRVVFGVKCSFAKSGTSSLVSLVPGQRVTIQGVCLGKMGTVMLADCELLR